MTTLLFAPVEPKDKIEKALKIIKQFDKDVIIYSNIKNCGYWDTQKEQACDLIKFLKDGDTHLLHCEWDGLPINPHLWKDEFLQYDYIGAPWGPKEGGYYSAAQFTGRRIGNGGFSLRSRKFLELCYVNRRFYQPGIPSDVWICAHPYMVSRTKDCKFPDIKTALEFSFEGIVPEYPNWNKNMSFGAHGKNI